MSNFKLAKSQITRYMIESFFPGGRWTGKEYFVLSPLRPDRNIGSFHINESGVWFDHATNEGGDFITLVSRSNNCTPGQAVDRILGK